MALGYHSKFYYVDPVNDNNFYMNFIEPNKDNVELTAEVAIGEYTPTTLVEAVEEAMNATGSNTYQVVFDRLTNRVVISSDDDVNLLVSSGSLSGVSIYRLIGFTGTDSGVVTMATGNSAVAKEFSPQFWLQNYIPTRMSKKAVSGVQSVSAAGRVEVVSFGRSSFVEMNIKYQNNYNESGNALKPSTTGVEDLIYFMDFIINKYPIEFMENENNPDIFEVLILESTPDDNTGLGYKLIEMVSQNIAGYYETGRLVFRLVE